MDRIQHKETFRAGRSYDVMIMGSGEVIFALTYGKADSWGHEIPSTSLAIDSEGRSISIFRSVMHLLSGMVYKYRPPVLWFYITDAKRKPLYKRLVKKFLEEHTAYVSCDDDWEDQLYVVRTKEPAS